MKAKQECQKECNSKISKIRIAIYFSKGGQSLKQSTASQLSSLLLLQVCTDC